MCGKMQEPGLTEIISLIHSSALWGQHSVFSHVEFCQVAPLEMPVGAACWMSSAMDSPIVSPFCVFPQLPSGQLWWNWPDGRNILCLMIWQAECWFSQSSVTICLPMMPLSDWDQVGAHLITVSISKVLSQNKQIFPSWN